MFSTNFTKPVNKSKVRINDFIASGHLHRGFCERKQHSLGFIVLVASVAWISLYFSKKESKAKIRAMTFASTSFYHGMNGMNLNVGSAQ